MFAKTPPPARLLASMFHQWSLVFTCVCGVTASFDTPCLYALVGRTGGSVWLRPSTADPELEEDLTGLLHASSTLIPNST